MYCLVKKVVVEAQPEGSSIMRQGPLTSIPQPKEDCL